MEKFSFQEGKNGLGIELDEDASHLSCLLHTVKAQG